MGGQREKGKGGGCFSSIARASATYATQDVQEKEPRRLFMSWKQKETSG